MLIDTHAHVNFNAFKDDAEQVIRDSLKNDTWVVNVGSEFRTSRRAVDFAERFDQGVYAVVGLHPIHLFSQQVDEEEISFISREEQFDYEKYKKLAESSKVVGIGECGLEYFHLPKGKEQEIKETQKEVFLSQVRLAAELKKALMVHSRDAYEDIYNIIKDVNKGLTAVIIHSFIGGPKEAEKFLDLGCYLSFNGIITYKPRKEKKPGQSDPELLEVVKNTPLNRILLETDCPYLSPEPLRGKRNVPVNVKLVAQKIAELKNIAVDEVERQTTNNARAVFKI